MEPRIQYVTTSDGVSIAHSVLPGGSGRPCVYMPGAPFTHIQREMMDETFSTWIVRTSEFRPVVLFDHRGTGLSDRSVQDLSLDGLLRDMDAVVDKSGLAPVMLAGAQASGIISLAYALRHPEKVSHLALIDAYPSGKRYAEIPQIRAFLGMIDNDWDLFTESLAHSVFGWSAGESARTYAAYLRDAVNQGEAKRFFDAIFETDLMAELADVVQPTVVFHHVSSVFPDMSIARQMAATIPNARLMLMEGTWLDPSGDFGTYLRGLAELAGEEVTVPATDMPAAAGGLVTILFTDVESSTALTQQLGDAAAREVMREHERITREALLRFGGSEVKTMGDGFMASFTSATRALDCAIEMQRAFARRNAGGDAPVNVRIGLNAGEPIAEEEDLFGTAVITAARIAAKAAGGEVLAANVVRELVAGKGYMFSDKGEMVLRGFDDPVRVFALRWEEEISQ